MPEHTLTEEEKESRKRMIGFVLDEASEFVKKHRFSESQDRKNAAVIIVFLLGLLEDQKGLLEKDWVFQIPWEEILGKTTEQTGFTR